MKTLPAARNIIMYSLLIILMIFGAVTLNSCKMGENLPSTKQGIRAAQKSTPLTDAINTYNALPLLAVHGKDKNQQELIVFVNAKKEIEGYVYLQDGVSSAKAAEAAKKHLNFAGEPDIVDLFWYNSKPYWHVQKGLGADVTQVSVDFYTGNVIR